MAEIKIRRPGQKKQRMLLEDAAERALMLSRLLYWAAEEAGRLGGDAEAGQLKALSDRVRELPMSAGDA